MFLELHRMKDEVSVIKLKTGISTNNNLNQISSSGVGVGTKIILGNNAGLGGGLIGYKKDDRRFDPSLSSAGSSIFEMNRNNLRGENTFR